MHIECPKAQNREWQAGVQTQAAGFQGPALSPKIGIAHVVSGTCGLAESIRVNTSCHWKEARHTAISSLH